MSATKKFINNAHENIDYDLANLIFEFRLFSHFLKVKIKSFVVSDSGKCQLPDAFYRIKEYCY